MGSFFKSLVPPAPPEIFGFRPPDPLGDAIRDSFKEPKKKKRKEENPIKEGKSLLDD